MPLNDDGTYTPPSVSGYYPSDLYNFGAGPAQYKQQGVSEPYGARRFKFDTKIIDRLPQGDIIAWRTIIEDTQGGLNRTRGRMDLDFDRVSSSSLDTRFYKTLTNHLITGAFNLSHNSALRTHAAMFENLLHMAGGNVANNSLYREVSLVAPQITPITFTPANAVSALASVVFGGQPRLFVGDVVGVARSLDPSYTSTATGITALWGIVQTFINDQQLLVYYGTSLGTLSPQAAINTVPTTTLSNVPSGGQALGLVKLAGAPVRVALVWPVNNTAFLGLTQPGRIVTVNQEGTDYQYVPMGITNIVGSCLYGDQAIIATDGKRIMFYDGRSQSRDLMWASEREPDSDWQYTAIELAMNGNELIVAVNYIPADAATVTGAQYWLESYNFETNSWHQISAKKTPSASAVSGITLPAPVGLPISTSTHWAHVWGLTSPTTVGEWLTRMPVYGYNPYNMERQTVGAGASTGFEFESTGTYTSPYWTLPGLEGAPSMVSKITFLGDVDSGGTSGTAATVQVTAGNLTATFATGLARRAQITDMVDSGEVFYQLQVQITQTRNSGSTRWTPNGLPVMIEGYSWVPKLQPPFGWVDDGQ